MSGKKYVRTVFEIEISDTLVRPEEIEKRINEHINSVLEDRLTIEDMEISDKPYVHERDIFLDKEDIKNGLIDRMKDDVDGIPAGKDMECLVNGFVEFLRDALRDWLDIQYNMYMEDDGVVEDE